MRPIVIAISLSATVLLCIDGAQAAPRCARYSTGLNACNFYSFQQCMCFAIRRRRSLRAESIRKSTVDGQSGAQDLSARLLTPGGCIPWQSSIHNSRTS